MTELQYNDSCVKYALDCNLDCFEYMEVITDDVNIRVRDLRENGKGYLNQWGYERLNVNGIEISVYLDDVKRVLVDENCVSFETKHSTINFVVNPKYKSQFQFIHDYNWYKEH